jgi:hypothetical protein
MPVRIERMIIEPDIPPPTIFIIIPSILTKAVIELSCAAASIWELTLLTSRRHMDKEPVENGSAIHSIAFTTITVICTSGLNTANRIQSIALTVW